MQTFSRAFNVIKTWVDKHWYDFSKDAAVLLAEVEKTLDEIKAVPELQPKNFTQLVERIQKLVFSLLCVVLRCS
jgi:hypothetical protein